MLKGLLRPLQDTRDAWLFPAMATTWRKSLGADGVPRHYPKPPIVVNADALNDIFTDDTLHCVCNALCCDRQTVFVRGDCTLEDFGERGEPLNILDGNGRDYGLHLELRPIEGRCTLEVLIKVEVTADPDDDDPDEDADPVVIDICRQVAVIRNLRGVVFHNFDFNVKVEIYCASEDRDKVKYRVQSLLECVSNCPGCAFRGCTANIAVTVHNLNRHKPRYIDEYGFPGGGGGGGGSGWGGGGYGFGGGGGGGGGGFPGWRTGRYDWPSDDDGDDDDTADDSLWWAFGEKDVIIRALGFSSCPNAVFFDTRANIDIAAESLIGAESVAIGWHACGGWLHRLSQGEIKNKVFISGSGQAYTVYDGSHGIADYSLTALAESRLVSHSGGGEISTFAGAASAIAYCTAGNTPYHTDKDGNTSKGKIGGVAMALAFGLIGNRGGAMSACCADCSALARHPTNHAALAASYRANTAQETANTGSRPYCDSSIPDWCASNS